jgi:hypothetical protein
VRLVKSAPVNNPMNTGEQSHCPGSGRNPLALLLCGYKHGRVLLHICAAVRRPRNFLWHCRCLLREFSVRFGCFNRKNDDLNGGRDKNWRL